MAKSGPFFVKTVGGNTAPSGLTKALVWGLPVFLLIAALFLSYAAFSWVSAADETTGTVIAVERVFEDRNAESALADLYLPRFSYVNSNGDAVEALLSMAGKQFDLEIGSEHQILFDPTTNSNVRLADVTYNYALPMGVAYLCGVSAFLAMLMWFWIKAIGRRRNSKEMS